jgi:hypothetical protein
MVDAEIFSPRCARLLCSYGVHGKFPRMKIMREFSQKSDRSQLKWL